MNTERRLSPGEQVLAEFREELRQMKAEEVNLLEVERVIQERRELVLGRRGRVRQLRQSPSHRRVRGRSGRLLEQLFPGYTACPSKLKW